MSSPLPLLMFIPTLAFASPVKSGFVELNAGLLRHRYHEADPAQFTANGILDTDQGTLPHVRIRARWQDDSLPLLVQASAQRSTGNAAYDGYLQQGGRLTPFRTDIH